MSTELTTERRETGVRHRGPLTWAVAAAAVAVIATAGLLGFWALRDDGTTPAARPPEPVAVTTVSVPSRAAAGKCLAPSAELLASAQVAVEGTVTEVSSGWATVQPRHWYAGGPTGVVRVEVPDQAISELVAPDLVVGSRYLLAAVDGQLMVCGFSGPYDEQLAALYAEAFGG